MPKFILHFLTKKAGSNFIFGLILVLLGSCAFLDLKKDIEPLTTASTLEGNVTRRIDRDTPILVALYRDNPTEQATLENYAVLYGSLKFEMIAEPGSYYLVAFEDLNEDFTLQEDEFVGWFGRPSLITVEGEKKYTDLNIRLVSPEQTKFALPKLYKSNIQQAPLSRDVFSQGEVVTQYDPRFSNEVANMGMWQPVKYYKEGNAGIFFLEPYNPAKIPVLFFHGLRGSGRDWFYLIENLDLEKFQPWIAQYPSGMRLDLLTRGLDNFLKEMKIRYNFKELVFVSHSMGGLLARGLFNRKLEKNSPYEVTSLITIATPWDGHSGAQDGIVQAPVVVPSWYDMAPQSPYLEALFKKQIPPQSSFHLLFTYKNSIGFFRPENSDGTVTLQSQLKREAQDQAAQIIGYDENHISVLRSDQVAKDINLILSSLKNGS
jgi:pimeloyl-ACP methyl ester carboxylesterase